MGTGLGNAIYIRGRIWEGFNGAAAELGHIPVLGSGTECPCGKRGCIEPLSSGKRLTEIHREHFSGVSYEDIFTLHGGSPVIAEFIEAVSAAVATEIVILDPEYVIIGGGVVDMKDFPFGLLTECILRHIRRNNQEACAKLLFAGEDKWAGVAGAVYRLLEETV